jgi:hypothetical protein
MELPEHGNRGQIAEALFGLDEKIDLLRAEIKTAEAHGRAIQQMCEHEYVSHPYMPTWKKCKHCEFIEEEE